MKCDSCKIMEEINKSEEPVCCCWFMDNVVCSDKSVDDCSTYERTE